MERPPKKSLVEKVTKKEVVDPKTLPVYEDVPTYEDTPVYEDTRVYEETPSKKIYKAGVVDVSALAEAQAKDVADHRLTESKEDRSKNWFTRTAKRIWKHDVFKEWYRDREIKRVRKEILESGNLYAGETEDTNVKDYEKAKEAIIERFTSEYEDEMLRKGEKESKESITDEKAKEDIKALIKEFAGDSTMSEAAFTEEQNRILAHSNPAYAEKGKLYASNLLDIAKEIRNSIAHGEKLAEMDFDVEITLGQARESLNTEAQHNGFEKIIEKGQNSKLGKYIFNEPVAVSIAAGLYSAGNFLGLKLLRSKVAKWGTFGGTAVLAGAVSASKEAARLNRERAQHMRESAKGIEFKEDDMERRKQMEENRYETRNAAEIIQNLQNDLAKISVGNIKEGDLNAVLLNLSDLEARIKLGDQKKLDLVAYSKFNEIEKERMTLDLLRAKIKVAIRKGIREGRIEFTKQDNFDAHLQQLVDIQAGDAGDLSKDIEEKNKIYKTMKRKKVAWAFVKTTLLSGAAGFVFQEIRSAFQEQTDGMIEGVVKHFRGNNMASKTTALEGLRRWISGDASHLPFGTGHEMVLGNTHMQLPDGVSINQNPDGTYDILRGSDIVSSHAKLDFAPNGDLTDASKAILSKNDIITNFTQTGTKITQDVTMDSQEYINKHPELTTKMHRVWMDNDTPMRPDPNHPGHLIGADKNELKLEWGGDKGTGIDANKNYVFNVEHMTDDGSFHKGLSVAAQEQMKKGKLEVLFSITKGSQDTVMRLPIDANGNAVIDPNSPIGQMMFRNINGHAVFTGQYAEIGHSTGFAADGQENMRILSTHTGTGNPCKIVDTIICDKTASNVKLDVPLDWDYEVPPVIPIPYRRPLEKGKYEKDRVVGGATPVVGATYDETYLDKSSLYEDSTYSDKNSTYEDVTYTDKNSTYYEDPAYVDKYIADMKDYLDKNTDVNIKRESLVDKKYVEKYIEDMKDYLDKNTNVRLKGDKEVVKKYVEKYIADMKDYLDYLEKSAGIYMEKKKPMDQREIEKHIGEMQDYAKNKIDITMMEEFNAQVGEPMSSDAKISVVLPCYKEGENIYKTLSDWTTAQKDLKPEELEIIAFVNAPKKHQPFDEKTISEITRFQTEHPEYKVRLVKHNFNFKSGVKMGAIYKAAADLALYRNIKRLGTGASQETVAGHLMRAGGADALGRNPRFLRETIDFMENHQETEQLRTQSAYPAEVREKFPLFNLVTVFNHSLSQLYMQRKGNIGLGTFRARIYAEASGFDAARSYREEIDLGMKIRNKVGGKKGAINKLVKKNAIDNPRRELFALTRGETILHAYSGFANPEREAALRKFDWNKELPTNLKKNTEVNRENMNREFDAYFQHYQKKVAKESGIIPQILNGELNTKSAKLHPETRLLLKDPYLVRIMKEVDTERRTGKKISRSPEKVKKIAEHITKQLFDRILSISFGLKKGPNKDYNYAESGDKKLHIVFGPKSIDKLSKASKAKWQNFEGYWDKKKKPVKDRNKKTREGK